MKNIIKVILFATFIAMSFAEAEPLSKDFKKESDKALETVLSTKKGLQKSLIEILSDRTSYHNVPSERKKELTLKLQSIIEGLAITNKALIHFSIVESDPVKKLEIKREYLDSMQGINAAKMLLSGYEAKKDL